jgi:hypothetical protein
LHAERLGAEIREQPSEKRPVQVIVAEDAPTVHAHAAFDQVDASVTLVAVRRDLRAAKEFDLCHRLYIMLQQMSFAKAALH